MIKAGAVLNNRYHIESLLGEGGMGTVYLVRDLLHPEKILLALKLLQVPKENEAEWVSWFKNEFHLLTTLRHPCLAQVYDFGRDNESGRHYYTSEYVCGKDVFEATRGLSILETAPILLQICHGLEFIHAKGVLHNDLKIANILVAEKNRLPKILDFGLSFKINADLRKGLRGTLPYLAPELLEGKPPSVQTDLFALGIIFYKILAGRRPQEGQTRSEVIKINRSVNFPPLKTFNPKIDPKWEHFVFHLLAKDPTLRPASAQEASVQIQLLTKQADFEIPSEFILSFTQIQKLVGKESSTQILKRYLQEQIAADPSHTEKTISFTSLAPGFESKKRSFAVIQGDAGTGKTFLLNILKRDSQLVDIPFCLVNALQSKTAFSAWIHAVSELSGYLKKQSPIHSRFGDLLGFFRQDHLPEEQENATDGFARNQAELFYQLSSFLSESFMEHPYVLAFDHADALDSFSREFLRHLHHLNQHDARLKLPPVVLALREPEALRGFVDKEQLLWVELASFSLGACRIFLDETFFPQSTPEKLSEKLWRLSGGTPRFLQEILRELVLSKKLYRSHDQWNLERVSLDKIQIPASLEDLLKTRFEKLGEAEKSLLCWMVCWGEPLDFKSFALLTRENVKSLEKGMLSLAENELVQKDKQNAWWFAQPVFADIVAKKNDAAQTMHFRCAEILEVRSPKPWQRLATHYVAAKCPSAGAVAAYQAARQANRLFAHQEAEGFFRLAMEQASLSDHPVKENILALSGLADTLWRQGKRSKALETYQQLLDETTANQHGTKLRIAALRALGIACRDRGDYAQAMEQLENALNQCDPADTFTRADLMAHLSYICLQSGKETLANKWFKSAKEHLSPDASTQLAAAPALLVLATTANQSERLDEAQSFYEHALKLYQTHKDQRGCGNALSNLGSLAAKRGNFSEAEALFQQALNEFNRVSDAIGQAHSYLYLGNIAYLRGSFAEAAEDFHHSLDLAIRIDNRHLIASVETSLGQLETDRGHFAAARHYLKSAYERRIQMKDDKGLQHVFQGLQNLSLKKGRIRSVVKWARKSLASSPDPQQKMSSLLNLAIAACPAGQSSQAENYLDQATKIFPEVKSESARFHFLLSKSEILYRQKSFELSKLSLKEAASFSKKIFNPMLAHEFQWQQIRTEFRLRQSGKGTDFSDLRLSLEKIRSHPEMAENPFLDWQTAFLLGQILAKEQKTPEALSAYQIARSLLLRLMEDFSSEARKAFLNDPDKQEVFRTSDELSQSSPVILIELQKARQGIENLNRIMAINEQLIRLWSDRKGQLQIILDTAIELVGAKRGFVVLRNQEDLELAVSRDISRPDVNDLVNEFSRSLVRRVLEKGLPQLVVDAGSEQNFHEQKSVVQLHLKSIVCIPLRFHQEIKGVLYLDHDEIPNQFTAEHIDLLSILANQAVIALENSRTLQEFQDSTDRLTLDLTRSQSLLDHQSQFLQSKYQYHQLIGGKDLCMKQVLSFMERIIPSRTNVLIQGESGTGKELIAKSIHFNGPRKDKPFIALNCAGFNAPLFESELFGHVKGAFTGALRDKEGLFSLANGGTLFLDEIGDMPLDIQPKLLRTLEAGEIRPVGGKESTQADVRIISASNKPLFDLVRQGLFREDLYYRLNVVNLDLPPLRERPLDMDLLIDALIKEFSAKKDGKRRGISQKARKALHQYAWPGNIRELYHVLEQMIALYDVKTFKVENLPERIRAQLLPDPRKFPSMNKAQAEFAKKYVTQLMMVTKGHVTRAAQIAGLRRETLSRYLTRFGIQGRKKR